MMLDWNNYQRELGGRLSELSRLSPDTLKGYKTLSAANSQTTGAALIYSSRVLDAVAAKSAAVAG